MLLACQGLRLDGTRGSAAHCCRMTMFYFDIDGSGDPADDGLDLPDVETALSAALQAFPDMLRDREPLSNQTRFQLTVRNAMGPLFQITLDLLPGSSPTMDPLEPDGASARPDIDQRTPFLSHPGQHRMSTEDTALAAIAKKHAVSLDAVAAARDALRRGGGRMAQFSHADFGGMAQWSKGGMSMVGDMFNTSLKAKLVGVMGDLAALPDGSSDADAPAGGGETASSDGQGWPEDFGSPSSTGSQNGMRYAYFRQARRLVVEQGGARTIYDTGEHVISGASQQQAGARSLRFSSQSGDIDLDALPVTDDARPASPQN